jgi:two-component system response regulator NreC
MNAITILIADDHDVLRRGLRALVDAEPDMTVVGEAATGIEACQLANALRPDVVVLDVTMPSLGGAQATERLRSEVPDTRLLVLTRHASVASVRRLLTAGANGYVLKQTAAEELIFAIRKVAGGGTYLDPTIAGEALSFMAAPRRGETQSRSLTEREQLVLHQTAWGHSNKEIAGNLQISVKTVETHKANLMQKLGLKSRAELVRYAVREGWLHEE